MSYPDLGCFAECLECELCSDVDPDYGDIDLDLGWDDYERLFGDENGYDDYWAPPAEQEPDQPSGWPWGWSW